MSLTLPLFSHYFDEVCSNLEKKNNLATDLIKNILSTKLLNHSFFF